MPRKILVVEDHSDDRELLIIQLRRMRYEAIGAESAEEGLEKAASEAPDLIIMDLGLPGINGIEATTRLKRNPKTSHIPVIAFTAWNETRYKEKALQAGMAGFLSKPTPPQVLRQIIDKFLQEV